MAGSLTAAELARITQIVQNATGAPTGVSSDLFLNLYHTTLTDAVALGTTGRLGDNFQTTLVNTTATWTLASSTSPSSFNNKVNITVTTAAASTATVKAFTLQDTSTTGAGNIIAWGDVTPNQTVTTGNTVQFSTGALTFTLGGTTGGVAT
jgi:hypothetical protein